MTDILIDARRGAGSSLEILYGTVTWKPTLTHSRGTSIVLPAPTTFDLVDGQVVATNVQPTPEPVEGQIEWAYEVTFKDRHSKSYSFLVGVPDSTSQVNFISLPRYFETRPPAYGQGPQGVPGEAATIEIGSVTSGGATPSVNNSGTNTDAVLNFVLPKGDKGDTGTGVPEGGSALQVIRKNAGNTTTEWATLTKALVGLENVDNTSDSDKPVSTAQATAIANTTTLGYASKSFASPASGYKHGVTVFLARVSDGWPTLDGSAFVQVVTYKLRGADQAVQYLYPYRNGEVSELVGYRSSDITGTYWGEVTFPPTLRDVHANSGAVEASALGVIADGVVDDTTALNAALDYAASNGKELLLPKNTTIALSGALTFPQGTVVRGRGATLYFPVPAGNWMGVLGGSGVRLLNMRFLADTSTNTNIRGISAIGVTDIELRKVTVEGTSPGTGAGSLNRLGLDFQDCEDITLSKVKVINFDFPVRFARVKGISYNKVSLIKCIRGLYLLDVQDSSFSHSHFTGDSPNASASSGHNSVLIEASAHNGTRNLRFDGMTSTLAGEHGYRLGGSFKIKDVWFSNSISRSSGGCGFKVLGGRVEDGNYHENIYFDNCIVEDGGQDNAASAAFMLQFVKNVTVTSPIVRKVAKPYSIVCGFNIQAAENVEVISPTVRDTMTYGYLVSFVLGNCDSVNLRGGTFITTSGDGIQINATNRQFRNINITGMPVINVPGSVVNVVKTENTVFYPPNHLEWISASSSANQLYADADLIDFDIKVLAPYPSTSVVPVRNGSWWTSSATGTTYLRKGYAWVAV